MRVRFLLRLFAVFERDRVLIAIDVFVSPRAVLFVGKVIADLDAAVGSFN